MLRKDFVAVEPNRIALQQLPYLTGLFGEASSVQKNVHPPSSGTTKPEPRSGRKNRTRPRSCSVLSLDGVVMAVFNGKSAGLQTPPRNTTHRSHQDQPPPAIQNMT